MNIDKKAIDPRIMRGFILYIEKLAGYLKGYRRKSYGEEINRSKA